ncbi:hypothetical protein [Brumimicrobium mesophilum]|uniref:hypothetical protein n=1 Tax=Brumimicrobium mesophilum TaxID=392717 RepID=UPI000D1404BC|nr:hypothetical protein [Brumimicrobium mesophilum]
MKNTKAKEGWLNRHVDGLPTGKCKLIIDLEPFVGPDENANFLCYWHPVADKEIHTKGYLGTATVGENRNGIGFHAWEQNNSEFVYYKIV